MTNLTQYGSGELSMHFLNDQSLYNILMSGVRRSNFAIVKEAADEFFDYDADQLEDLEDTFNEEMEEYNS